MERRSKGDEAFETWPLLLETHTVLVELLERELDDVGGLSLSWYDVLVQLAMAPEGKLKMNELAGSVLLSKSGITRLVDRMEADGLIKRSSCKDDRRAIYATITPKGRQLFDRACPLHMRGVERHLLAHLTEQEVTTLRSAFHKVLEAAHEVRSVRAIEEVRLPG